MSEVILRAVRGANSIAEDTPEAIREGTCEMLGALLERNGLGPDDMVSLLFTLTPDLRAEFPAVAARRMGLSAVPLLCAAEIDVPGALPRCVRVLAHCHMPAGREVQHVYMGEARTLRPDLAGP
jgi:chorismate mutase